MGRDSGVEDQVSGIKIWRKLIPDCLIPDCLIPDCLIPDFPIPVMVNASLARGRYNIIEQSLTELLAFSPA
jgi:hypothetical protein